MAALAPKVAVAPMMDVTTRHFRHLLRLMSPHTTLYTEMYVDQAVIRRSLAELDVGPAEGRTVVQLGGSNPATMASAARKFADAGFSEVNLNIGCPSPKVTVGSFGCSLMMQPALVAQVADAVADATQRPVTIKCRLGVVRERNHVVASAHCVAEQDDHDSDPLLHAFVHEVTRSGTVQHVIVHARKAWLSGVSPRHNRTVPPLQYDRAYRVKHVFPHLAITINGGIVTGDDIDMHLRHVDGVMIGRQAARDPYMFASLDHAYFAARDERPLSRDEVLARYIAYAIEQAQEAQRLGRRLHTVGLLKPILPLYHGCRSGKQFRRLLSENVTHGQQNIVSMLQRALEYMLTAAAPPQL